VLLDFILIGFCYVCSNTFFLLDFVATDSVPLDFVQIDFVLVDCGR
jgi:hypothetical protein